MLEEKQCSTWDVGMKGSERRRSKKKVERTGRYSQVICEMAALWRTQSLLFVSKLSRRNV